jgi:hypothetical protein
MTSLKRTLNAGIRAAQWTWGLSRLFGRTPARSAAPSRNHPPPRPTPDIVLVVVLSPHGQNVNPNAGNDGEDDDEHEHKSAPRLWNKPPADERGAHASRVPSWPSRPRLHPSACSSPVIVCGESNGGTMFSAGRRKPHAGGVCSPSLCSPSPTTSLQVSLGAYRDEQCPRHQFADRSSHTSSGSWTGRDTVSRNHPVRRGAHASRVPSWPSPPRPCSAVGPSPGTVGRAKVDSTMFSAGRRKPHAGGACSPSRVLSWPSRRGLCSPAPPPVGHLPQGWMSRKNPLEPVTGLVT